MGRQQRRKSKMRCHLFGKQARGVDFWGLWCCGKPPKQRSDVLLCKVQRDAQDLCWKGGVRGGKDVLKISRKLPMLEVL